MLRSCLPTFFFHPITSFHLFLPFSFLGLCITTLLISLYGWSLCWWSLLAGTISSGFDAMPFHSEKDSYSLFTVDGMLIQCYFVKNWSRALCEFILSRAKKILVSAGIEPGSLLETIYKANALPLNYPAPAVFLLCVLRNFIIRINNN